MKDELYPVGTMIKIKSLEDIRCYHQFGNFPQPGFNNYMKEFTEKEGKIVSSWVEIGLPYYFIDIDNEGWIWSDWMFEPIADESGNYLLNFKGGNMKH